MSIRPENVDVDRRRSVSMLRMKGDAVVDMRMKRRRRTRSPCWSSIAVCSHQWFLLACVLLLSPAQSQLVYLGCQVIIKDNAGGNAWLSEEEFVDVVYDLSLGTYDYASDAQSVPAAVASTFVDHATDDQGINIKAAISPNSASDEDVAVVEAFCLDLLAALADSLGVGTVTAKQCNNLVASADNGDERFQSAEFAKFVTDNSDYGAESLSLLPEMLQVFYRYWQSNGSINFFRNGDEYKLSFCVEALVRLAAMDQSPLADGGTDDGGGGTDDGGIDDAVVGTDDFLLDDDALNATDDATNGGDIPSVAPVGGSLAPTAEGGVDTLPPTSVDSGLNESLAPAPDDDGDIGSLAPAPGPAVGDDEVPADSMAPTPASTISETFFQSCKTALIIGDATRDDQLSDDEFVRFLNRLLLNEFYGMGYDQLPGVLQEAFVTLAGDMGYIDVAGSKPGDVPSAEQEEHIYLICALSDRAINKYENPAPSIAPIGDSNSTGTGGGDLPTEIDDQFYSNCRTAMVIGDLSRDDILDAVEYVRFLNRILLNEFAGITLDQLDTAFQSSYNTLSAGSGGIEVAGSKPGAVPTADQLANLQAICLATSQAIYIYQNPGDGEPPVDSPTAVSTPAPTLISNANLNTCKIALIVADRDRNDFVSQDEYVYFINRLTASTYALFTDLDAVLQENFGVVSNGNALGVDVSGHRPGQTPTAEQQENLEVVCSQTKLAVDGEAGPANPSGAPVEAPSVVFELTDELFRLCKTSLAIGDLNRDGWLEPTEYVRFLNRIASNEFADANFTEIDSVLQASYEVAKGAHAFVDVAGASSASPTDDQVTNLEAVCTELLSSLEQYQNPSTGVDSAECLAALAEVDGEGSEPGVLEPSEYIALVNKLTGNLWQQIENVDELPFVVGDNFEWIKFGSSSVDISGVASGAAASAEETQQLERVCERTSLVSELASEIEADAPGNPLAYCTIPMSAADENEDELLDQTEFMGFVDIISALAWTDLPVVSRPNPLRDVFDWYKDDSGQVPIPASNPDGAGTPAQQEYLVELCGAVEAAVVQARQEGASVERCITLLAEYDSDADGQLSREEYPAFLYALAGADFNEETFDDLDRVLQLTYAVIRQGQSAVDISGTGGSPTEDQLANLKSVCLSIDKDIGILRPPTTAPTISPGTSPNSDGAVTVYNSFIISNIDGLSASGVPRAGLEKAYESFVKNLVQTASLTRFRSRRMQSVAYKPNSAKIYLIVDSDCPADARSKALCQNAFAKFDLVAADEARAKEYGELSQAAIDTGDLQSALEATDPGNFLVIEGTSTQLLPSPSDLNPTPAPSSASSTFFTLPVIIGIAAGGATLLFAVGLGLFIYCSRRRRSGSGGDDQKGFPPKQGSSSPYGQNYDPEGANNEGGMYNPSLPEAAAGYGVFETSKQDSFRQPPGGDYGNYNGDQAYGATEYGNGAYGAEEEHYGPPDYQPDEDESASIDGELYHGAAALAADPPSDDGFTDFASAEPQSAFGGASKTHDFFGASSAAHKSFDAKPDEHWGSSGNQWSNNEDHRNFFVDQPAEPVSTSHSTEEQSDHYTLEDDDVTRATAMTKATAVSRVSQGSHVSAASRNSHVSAASRTSHVSAASRGSRASRLSKTSKTSSNSRQSHQSRQSQRSASQYESSSGEEESEEEEEEEEEEESESEYESEDESEDDTIEASVVSSSPPSNHYRAQIEELVREVVPDELGNVDAMMEQFVGREEELLETLQNMAEMAVGGESSEGEDSEEYEEEGDEEEGEDFEEGSYESGSYDDGSVEEESYYSEEEEGEEVVDEESYYSEEEGGGSSSYYSDES